MAGILFTFVECRYRLINMMKILRVGCFIILLVLPEAVFPIMNVKYPFKPADLFILFFSSVQLLTYTKWKQFQRPVLRGVYFLIFCFFSVFWGGEYLSRNAILNVLENGQQVEYYSVAFKKFLLVLICLLGVQYFLTVKAVKLGDLLKYWYYGLCIAFLCHLLTYLSSDDLMLRRGGVFLEGNHGGSYYLLSFFLMWHSLRLDFHFARMGMCISFLALLLSQSSASIIVFLILCTSYLISQFGRIGIIRYSVYLFGFFAVSLVLASMFGDEIYSKFFEKEITAASYSRYDRLSSVMSALDMFRDSPVFGVGIQGYAYALQNYGDSFLRKIYNWDYRRIPNNIYAEVLCEMGVTGIWLFFYWVWSFISPIARNFRTMPILVLAFLSILGSWLAFPTYTVSFHWVGLAIIYKAIHASNGRNFA